MADLFSLGGRTYRSRLIVGTGKYKDFAETRRAIDVSGAEIVTVAVRRVNITDTGKENLLDHLDLKTTTILPNTAGCSTAAEAIRTARLARESGVARVLVKEGFVVLPYTTDDPITCKKLEDLGCAAVMPLAAPIGSGLGIRNPFNLRIILEHARLPIIVDAGVGTASAFRASSTPPRRALSTAESSRDAAEHRSSGGGPLPGHRSHRRRPPLDRACRSSAARRRLRRATPREGPRRGTAARSRRPASLRVPYHS
jgi:thiazole synthase ThiGH ThiG subunit